VSGGATKVEMVAVVLVLVVHADEPLDLRHQPSLLSELAQSRLCEAFALLAPPARQLPVQAAVGMADEQDAVGVINNSSGSADESSWPSHETETSRAKPLIERCCDLRAASRSGRPRPQPWPGDL
jgi:hypothetical protein